jgi:polyisoprenoid-binding protein YceI
MKNLILLTVALLSMNQVQAQTKLKTKKAPTQSQTLLVNYEIDNNATTVLWTGKKVTGKHYGKIKVSNGNLTTNGNKLNAGVIVIDMNSMTCDDIADAKSNADLVGHLKNEDFFNTASFPEAKLELSKVVYNGKANATIFGNLTIKDKTNPVSFKVKIVNAGDKLTAIGRLIFDRTKYDIKYGSTLFGAAADKAIENNVSLEISLVASKKG